MIVTFPEGNKSETIDIYRLLENVKKYYVLIIQNKHIFSIQGNNSISSLLDGEVNVTIDKYDTEYIIKFLKSCTKVFAFEFEKDFYIQLTKELIELGYGDSEI